MPDIGPKTTEAELAIHLPEMKLPGETGEHTYHQKPPAPGITDMDLRPAAIEALLKADARQARAPLGPSWHKG